jgi:hypothetical protein
MNTTQANTPKYTDAKGLVALGLYKSQQAVWNAVNRRAIPYRKDGRRVIFNTEEIITWIESKRQSTVEELDQQAATHLLTRSL